MEGKEGNKAGVAVPVTEIDYSTYTKDKLLAAIGKAYEKKDMKLMGKLSGLYAKKEAEELKAQKDKLLAELVAKTDEVKKAFDKLAQQLIDSGKYDGAEGFWYVKDFGEKLSALRLTKGAKKVSVAGEGGGKGSYVANPAKSADLLAQVGSHIYTKKATTATIDKVETPLPAGMTYQQAFDLSTNGGWRNRVRMALLKESGLI